MATWTKDNVDDFALRGAMNAGQAVFVYLQAIANGEVKPQLLYDECERLPAP